MKVNDNEVYWRQYRCLVTVSKKKIVTDIFYVEPVAVQYFTFEQNGTEQIVSGLSDVALPKAVEIPAGAGGLKVTEIKGAASEADGVFYQKITTAGSTLYLPLTVEKIGAYAFTGCSGLTTVTLSDKVSEIGQGAFKDCSSLDTMKTY